jgi:hypothetical protein
VIDRSLRANPVIASPKVKRNSWFSALFGVIGATTMAVGTVRSIEMAAASTAAAGPGREAKLVTPLAASLSVTFPAEQFVTVTVTDVPDAADGVNTQPVAAPVVAAFEKSAAAMPVTESVKLTV